MFIDVQIICPEHLDDLEWFAQEAKRQGKSVFDLPMSNGKTLGDCTKRDLAWLLARAKKRDTVWRRVVEVAEQLGDDCTLEQVFEAHRDDPILSDGDAHVMILESATLHNKRMAWLGIN